MSCKKKKAPFLFSAPQTTIADDLSAQLSAEVREPNPLAHWVVLNR